MFPVADAIGNGADMNLTDWQLYSGIAWKDGGRNRATGVDCVGLARLFLAEQLGIEVQAPATPEGDEAKHALAEQFVEPAARRIDPSQLQRGDVVFFRHIASGKIKHVAVCLGEGQFAHAFQGCTSRIERGFTLIERIGFQVEGWIPARDVQRLAAALEDPALGEAGTLILFVVGIALSLASALLAPRPSLNRKGVYSFDGLVTQNSPAIPLPDVLGEVVVAGNSPYTQLAEKGATATPASQKANKIVILASGPVELIDYQTGLQINGVTWADKTFFDGTNVDGMDANPPQSKAEAVSGSLMGETNMPSFTLYDGAHDIAVPVDVRARYDRGFPVYGFSGCAYWVGRLIDSTKFTNFNLTCRVQGRQCRTFDANGFVTATATSESLTGAHNYSGQSVTADSTTDKITLAGHALVNGDPLYFGGTTMPGGIIQGVTYYVVNAGTNDFQVAEGPGGTAIDITSNGTAVTITASKVRFKMAYEDIASVASLTVGGTSYAEISATAQTGNVYQLNRTKGYVEFLSAPAAGTSIVVTYDYYVRAWTANPANLIAYLLTEKGRGRGFDETRLDWARFVTARDYYDTLIFSRSADGLAQVTQWEANYALDTRKPAQEHLRAILDACHSELFVTDGKFVLKARTPGSSVFSFNTSNIIADSGQDGRSTFQSEIIDRAERPNRVKLFYHDADAYNAETEAVVDDEADQEARGTRAGNDGVVELNLKLPAVTSREQAERLATIVAVEQVNGRYRGVLTTNIQALAIEPGDIVDITHPSQPGWSAKEFWVNTVSHDEQDRLTLEIAEVVRAAYT